MIKTTNNNISYGHSIFKTTLVGSYSSPCNDYTSIDAGVKSSLPFYDNYSHSFGTSYVMMEPNNMSFLLSFISNNKIFMLSDSRQIIPYRKIESFNGLEYRKEINDNFRKIACVKENNSVFGLTGVSSVDGKDVLDFICNFSKSFSPEDLVKFPMLLREDIINNLRPKESAMCIHHGFFLQGKPQLFTYNIDFPSGILTISPQRTDCYSGDSMAVDLFNEINFDFCVPDAFENAKLYFDELITFTSRFPNHPVGGHTEYIVLQEDGCSDLHY